MISIKENKDRKCSCCHNNSIAEMRIGSERNYTVKCLCKDCFQELLSEVMAFNAFLDVEEWLIKEVKEKHSSLDEGILRKQNFQKLKELYKG